MILVGQSVKRGLGESPGDCRNCQKEACLKNSKGYLFRIKNAPRGHVLEDRLLYLTEDVIHFVLEELQHAFPDLPAFEVLLVFSGICPWQIADQKASEIIDRYQYCKEFNQSPYASYAETPAGWIQASRIISGEIATCLKAWGPKYAGT